jgi:hypothetical protein
LHRSEERPMTAAAMMKRYNREEGV